MSIGRVRYVRKPNSPQSATHIAVTQRTTICGRRGTWQTENPAEPAALCRTCNAMVNAILDEFADEQP